MMRILSLLHPHRLLPLQRRRMISEKATRMIGGEEVAVVVVMGNVEMIEMETEIVMGERGKGKRKRRRSIRNQNLSRCRKLRNKDDLLYYRNYQEERQVLRKTLLKRMEQLQHQVDIVHLVLLRRIEGEIRVQHVKEKSRTA